MNSYVKQCIAFLAGDTDEVKAVKIQRAATSALEAQIAVKTGETIGLEDAIAECEEAEKRALYNNGELLSKGSSGNTNYVTTLLDTYNRKMAAKEALEDHLKVIEFLKGRLREVKGSTKESAE